MRGMFILPLEPLTRTLLRWLFDDGHHAGQNMMVVLEISQMLNCNDDITCMFVEFDSEKDVMMIISSMALN